MSVHFWCDIIFITLLCTRAHTCLCVQYWDDESLQLCNTCMCCHLWILLEFKLWSSQLHILVLQVDTNISEEHAVSIFRVGKGIYEICFHSNEYLDYSHVDVMPCSLEMVTSVLKKPVTPFFRVTMIAYQKTSLELSYFATNLVEV